MKNLLILLAWAFLFSVGTAQAQSDPLQSAESNRQVFMMGLFPPDVIMKHQQRLGITSGQRKSISEAVKDFQSEVAELQWTMQNEQQQFKQALSGYTIENKQALAMAEGLLKMESEFKLAHYKLLFAIKNELTEEQIDMIKSRLQEKRAQGGR